MCFSIPLKVLKIAGKTAEMEDGRMVRLGELADIAAGDYLEVYADMAVTKIPPAQAQKIRTLIKASQ
jgi:hydrogenase maturation factor